MYRLGLKLWSKDVDRISQAERLFEKQGFDFIELYALPGSYKKGVEDWHRMKFPFKIHAPHWREGFNLAQKNKETQNLELMKEAQRFADTLKAETIIIHPGIAGEIMETARQIKLIGDARLTIENKPFYALDDGLICNGSTPEEIRLLLSEAKIGFCLDIGHAICSANAHQIDPWVFLADFIALQPSLYHLSDGDQAGVLDQHLHLGSGNFNISKILQLLPSDAEITLETPKDRADNLDDFVLDVEMVRKP